MTPASKKLHECFYTNDGHPYRVFERRINALISPDMTLLDAGCGRTAPVLKKYIGRVKHLIGVELVEFQDVPPQIQTHNTDLANIPVDDDSVDLIISRSVFEHLQEPDAVYKELSRILKPGGKIIFLTANMWDYGTMIARLIPNHLHASIVKFSEGRAEQDTFPTAYKTNTKSAVQQLAAQSGLKLQQIEYINQYPNYLSFNAFLFFLGIIYERITTNLEPLKFLRGWIMVTLEKQRLK